MYIIQAPAAELVDDVHFSGSFVIEQQENPLPEHDSTIASVGCLMSDLQMYIIFLKIPNIYSSVDPLSLKKGRAEPLLSCP